MLGAPVRLRDVTGYPRPVSKLCRDTSVAGVVCVACVYTVNFTGARASRAPSGRMGVPHWAPHSLSRTPSYLDYTLLDITYLLLIAFLLLIVSEIVKYAHFYISY